ncbi:hypothetical protein B0H19DRAFT_1105120 [Mycena capillaripes]|nr:hypothetical protein B0H19DRAFT_1105120 [Mycena capillaripes]
MTKRSGSSTFNVVGPMHRKVCLIRRSEDSLPVKQFWMLWVLWALWALCLREFYFRTLSYRILLISLIINGFACILSKSASHFLCSILSLDHLAGPVLKPGPEHHHCWLSTGLPHGI